MNRLKTKRNTFAITDPVIYTLGPEGTNCAAAAQWWFDSKPEFRISDDSQARIILHESLEKALEHLNENRNGYLLSCAAYPDLHTLIFTHLREMELFDSFIMPTHSMVLAGQCSAN